MDALWLLCGCFVVALWVLCGCFVVALWLLCGHFLVALWDNVNSIWIYCGSIHIHKATMKHPQSSGAAKSHFQLTHNISK